MIKIKPTSKSGYCNMKNGTKKAAKTTLAPNPIII
jgi:hypothetical protein